MKAAQQLQHEVKQRYTETMKALQEALPSYTIPIGDSRYTAPGWICLSYSYYCYQDVTYPWDPAVVRAIREFEPTMVPMTVRSVWQKADYGNLDHNEPLIIVRFGIARVVRDARIPIHNFQCGMPMHREPALRHDAHALAQVRPNWIELNNYADRDVRPYGPDLPGAFLPFDWELFNGLRIGYENGREHTEISGEIVEAHAADHAATEAARSAENAYIQRDIEAYQDKRLADVSDVEWSEVLTADIPPPESKPTVAIPSVPAGG